MLGYRGTVCNSVRVQGDRLTTILGTGGRGVETPHGVVCGQHKSDPGVRVGGAHPKNLKGYIIFKLDVD